MDCKTTEKMPGLMIGQGISKAGDAVSFSWTEDIEPENRGYVVHCLSAFVEGRKAGYLKIAYIPKRNWVLFNPTIWNFMQNFRGHCLGGKIRKDRLHPGQLEGNDLKDFIESALIAIGHRCNPGRDLPKDWDEFCALVEKLPTYRSCLAAQRKFRQYNIDKPHVAYSNTGINEHNGCFDDFRGCGIGTLLYLGMARVLDTRGMRLHASDCQTVFARNIWTSFQKKGLVATTSEKKPRSYLVVDENTPMLTMTLPKGILR